jgi:hypothetical protein
MESLVDGQETQFLAPGPEKKILTDPAIPGSQNAEPVILFQEQHNW